MKTYEITTTMTINKVGRKWMQCTDDATKREYKVLINETTKGTPVESKLTGKFSVTDKSDGWGVNREATYSKTDDNEVIEQLIARLIEVAEEFGSISKTTSARLAAYDEQLTDEQKSRIASAKVIVKRKEADEELTSRLSRLEDCVTHGYWSNTQEKNITELLGRATPELAAEAKKKMQELAESLASEKAAKKAAEKAKKEEYEKSHYRFYDYAGVYRVGMVICHKGTIGKVDSVKRGYVDCEDAFSFGHINLPDGGYYWVVTLDTEAVTEDERATVERAEEAKKIESRINRLEKELESDIRDAAWFGDKPEKAEPKGKVLVDTFNGYGYGCRLILCDNGAIWAVANNGADGDDWSRNNMFTGGAGAIASIYPADHETTKTLIEKLAKIKELKNEVR